MTALKVAIGISGGELARYAITYDSIMGLQRPEGAIHIQARGANIAVNRNGIAERALAADCTHVFYVDDDHIFPPDTLMKLLAHDKDVVSGLYVSREAPFYPQTYGREDEKHYVLHQLLEPFMSGLQEYVCTGAGCLLIKTDVFRKLEQPWWTLGQISKDGWCDDVDFCRRVREAGYQIFCDLEAPVGHICNLTAWPQRIASGDWTTVLIGANSIPLIQFPAAQHKRSLVSL